MMLQAAAAIRKFNSSQQASWRPAASLNIYVTHSNAQDALLHILKAF